MHMVTCSLEIMKGCHLAQNDVSHALGAIRELEAQDERLWGGPCDACLPCESLKDCTVLSHHKIPILHLLIARATQQATCIMLED